MHTGRELSSQLPRDKTHSNSRSVTGGELRIPFPLVLSPGRAPGLRLDHRSPDLRSPPGGSSALTPSRTHGGHDGDPPGTRGMGAPRGQAPGWGPRSGAQSTWQAGLQTSSFTKVSQGERETNSGPRKKAGNTGTSGRGFHWSAWNLWAGQKTRGGGRLLRSSPPWEPAQQWQPGEGEGRGALGLRFSVCGGGLRGGTKAGAASGLLALLQAVQLLPRCAGQDPPLKEALLHIQAVDFELFQGRIIQIDISD